MTEKDTIRAICNRLGVLEHEGSNWINAKLSNAEEETAEIWFNNDGTVDFVSFS